jgi:hypothetical protein
MPSDILGIDIGGVIITPARASGDTSFFSSDYLATPPMEGAFDAIARLGQERFDAVHLVSKCGPGVEKKTRAWLAHHGFHDLTGVPPERMHFCRARADKAPICKSLGVTHFVDDRLEVLGYLSSVPVRYLFQPDAKEMARHAAHLAHVRVMESWREIIADLTE